MNSQRSIFNWFGNNFYLKSSCTDGCPLKVVSVKSSQTAVILTIDTKCLSAFSSFVEGKEQKKLKPIFLRLHCPIDLVELPCCWVSFCTKKYFWKERCPFIVNSNDFKCLYFLFAYHLSVGKKYLRKKYQVYEVHCFLYLGFFQPLSFSPYSSSQ